MFSTVIGSTGMYAPAVNAIGFATNGGERLRIDSSGKVGIGTTAPESLLHVKGAGATASVKVERSAKKMWLDPNQGDGNTYAQLASDSGMGTDFTVNGATTAMRITSSGNVGIGTTNPTVKLDVAGGIRPGSSGITTGGACAGEGTMAYDLAAHAPVYCSNTGVWKAVGGGGSSFGGLYTYNQRNTTCDYVNPMTGGFSCPAGFNDSVVHNYYGGADCLNLYFYLHLCWK